MLCHEKQMKTACSDFASQIQDPELKSFVQGLSSKHQETFGKIYNLLSSN